MKNFSQSIRMMAILSIIVLLVSFQSATSATLTVTSPNGGEEFVAGTTTTITWSSDTTGNARIALLKGGVQVAVIAARTLNDGSLDWLIPETVLSGADYTVQISVCMIPGLIDVSDGDFSITGGNATTVTVIAPNGGEELTAGTTTTISWESDVAGDVRISLLKGGLHYSLISLSTPNDGSFDWIIPAGMAAGTEYSVKVASSTNFYVFDVSDEYFSINPGGGTTVTVLSPNGGEEFVAGTTNTISWTSDLTGNLRITLLKGGLDYALIAANTANDGSFDWSLPEVIASGDDFTVKVASCLDPALTDVSDGDFSITGGAGGSSVVVTAPNGGEELTAGTTTTITWTSDVVGDVKISLLKGGLHCALISLATPNDGSFDWTIPTRLAAGTEYSVKVASSANFYVFDVSDNYFSINPGGGTTVTVLSPNGGEEFVAGTTNTITWSSDLTGYLRVTLLKGGLDYAIIAAKIVNDGSFDWLVPEFIASGDNYTVKVASCFNPTLGDVSDNNFSITGGGGGSAMVVTAPNGGEELTAGTTTTINWESDVTGNVKISLLKGGLHYALISLSTPNDGSFDWTIPAGIAAGTEYTVKVASSSNIYLFDVSDDNFAIVAGAGYSVSVLSPNGGEIFTVGTICPITWTSNFFGSIRITLMKGGADYSTIAYKIQNTGSYNWMVPVDIALGNDYTIKIANCFNASIVDVSDADFEIVLAEFSLTKNSFKTGDNSTGIDAENSSAPTINIYPNPAIEKLNIAANGNINHIWLLNSVGQLVFETVANTPQIQLDVNDYKTDLYFVKIEVDGIIKTQKVFIK